MDKWLPSSTEGAFERFLTAAIATIITIIFSWRMLDKINEDKKDDEDDPERHRLGNFSSQANSSSFVSFSSSSSAEGGAGPVFISGREPTVDRVQYLGPYTQFVSQTGLSSRNTASKRSLSLSGDAFILSNLNILNRDPVDLPLCGDFPNNFSKDNAIFSRNGEPSKIHGDFDDALKSCDVNTGNQEGFIDCVSPGVDPFCGTHTREHVISVDRLSTMSWDAGRTISHTEHGIVCRNDPLTIPALSSVLDKHCSSDSSAEYTNNELADFTDSSIEDTGNNVKEEDFDFFLKIIREGRNNRLNDQNDENYEELGDIHNTSEERNVYDNVDDDFLLSSDNNYYQNEYDFDDVEPRELDSDEELFCCSILEPIMEENSDDITTSSEGDNNSIDKTLYSFIDTQVKYDHDKVEQKHAILPEDNTRTGRSDFTHIRSLENRPGRNFIAATDILHEPNLGSVLEQRPLSYLQQRTASPDNFDKIFKHINSHPAADPDYRDDLQPEIRPGLTKGTTHSDTARAQVFVANYQLDSQTGDAAKNIDPVRSPRSSVDRKAVNFVRELRRRYSSSNNLSEDFECLDDKGEGIFETETDFPKDDLDGFRSHSFLQTFSTRVEVEDSNSESDESIQTVISRQSSREPDGSPVRYQGKGVDKFTRPVSDGFLYSSRKWSSNEVESGFRVKNSSYGDGLTFVREEDSEDVGDFLQGKSNFRDKSEKDYNNQDLNSFPDEKVYYKLSDRFSSIEKQDSKFSENLENVETFGRDLSRSHTVLNKHGSARVEVGDRQSGRLFQTGEQTEQRGDVEFVQQNSMYFENVFVPEKRNSEVQQKVSFWGLHSGLDKFEETGKERDVDQVMDMDTRGYFTSGYDRGGDEMKDVTESDEEWKEEVIETFVLPFSHERGGLGNVRRDNDLFQVRGDERRREEVGEDDDDEEWRQDVVETFVLPVSNEGEVYRTIRSATEFLDAKRRGQRSEVKDEYEDNDEEYQSTCTTTMIEVEGQDSVGFIGHEDVMSGYREQGKEVDRTGSDLKNKFGFMLNLDEYKTDEYSTQEGWPVVRMIERERVYIDEVGDEDAPYQTYSGASEDRKEMPEDDSWQKMESANRNEIGETKKRKENKDKDEEIDEENIIRNYSEDEKEQKYISRYSGGVKRFKSPEAKPTILPNIPLVPATSVLTTRLIQLRASPSRIQDESNDLIRPPVIPLLIAETSSENVSLSEKVPQYQNTSTGQYHPSTASAYFHSEPDTPSFLRNITYTPDRQSKDSHSFDNSIQSTGDSVNNYADFVRHISGKVDTPKFQNRNYANVSPSKSTILSGNVAKDSGRNSEILLSKDDQYSRITQSSSGTSSKDSETMDARERYKGHDEFRNENQDSALIQKPRFARTSTAQDEEELLGFKHGSHKVSSGSMYDESTSVLNRSFDEASSGSFSLERSSSQSRANWNRSREDENKPRSKEIAESGFYSLERVSSSESSRKLSASISGGDIHQKASPKEDYKSLTTSMSADSQKPNSSPAQSPPLISSRVTRFILGSNFVEEKHILPSEDNRNSSVNPSESLDFGQRTKFKSDHIAGKGISNLSSKNVDPEPIAASQPILLHDSDVSESNPFRTFEAPKLSTGRSPYVPTTIATPQKESLGSTMTSKLATDENSPAWNIYRKGEEAHIIQTDAISHGSRREADDVKEVYKNKETDFTDRGGSDNEEDMTEDEESSDEYDTEDDDSGESSEDISDSEERSVADEFRRTGQFVGSANQESAQGSFSGTEEASQRIQDSSSVLEQHTLNFKPVSVTPITTARTSQAMSSTFVPLKNTSSKYQVNTDSQKKPKSMKEIKKRYKQPYKSVLTLDPTTLTPPKAAPFVLPEHLMTPSRLKIVQSRNRFLSEQNLHSASYTDEFAAHKETSKEPYVQNISAPKSRKYASRTARHGNYRSQEQLEKIKYMMSLKPGRSEGSLNIACLHDDCILSEKGRREVLDKTLSIENLDEDLHKCLRKFSSQTEGALNDAFFPETNSDMFDLTFPFQDELDRYSNRPASMGELRHAYDYSTISGSGFGIFETVAKRIDGFPQREYNRSRSLCALESDQDAAKSVDGKFQRSPSAHELRISRSLQKLNVPTWYRKSSLPQSGSCPSPYSSSPNMSWAFSPRATPSFNTTPASTTNVIIKSRVQLPTSARSLRSPHFPSKSAPATPSFTNHRSINRSSSKSPAPLPSEKLRAAPKPQSLQPIPIIPFNRVSSRLEQKSKKDETKTTKPELNKNLVSLYSQPLASNGVVEMTRNNLFKPELHENLASSYTKPFPATTSKAQETAKADISAPELMSSLTPSNIQPSAVIRSRAPEANREQLEEFRAHKDKDVSKHPSDHDTTIISSESDSGVKGILKRPQDENTYSSIQILPDKDKENHFFIQALKKTHETGPILSLYKPPVTANSPGSSKIEQPSFTRQIMEESPVISNTAPYHDHPSFKSPSKEKLIQAERPKSIELYSADKEINEQSPLSEKHFQKYKLNDEPSPVAKPRESLTSMSTSSTSSMEDTKEHQSTSQVDVTTDSSFDSPTIIPVSPESILASINLKRQIRSNDVSVSNAPTIIITPDTPKPQGSRHVNAAISGPKSSATTLERAPIIHPLDQKPFIAPVIEDHTPNEPHSYYSEASVPFRPWKTRPPSEYLEEDLNNSFDSNIPEEKHELIKPNVETEQKRSWVPKSKPSRRPKSSGELDHPKHEKIYSKIFAVKSTFDNPGLEDNSRNISSSPDLEFHRKSLISKELKQSGFQNTGSSTNFAIEDKPLTYEKGLYGPSGSSTPRSSDTQREIDRNYSHGIRSLARKQSIESNPNFTRYLDQVLDQYSSPEFGHVSGEDSESSTIRGDNHHPNSGPARGRSYDSSENERDIAYERGGYNPGLKKWDRRNLDGEQMESGIEETRSGRNRGVYSGDKGDLSGDDGFNDTNERIVLRDSDYDRGEIVSGASEIESNRDERVYYRNERDYVRDERGYDRGKRDYDEEERVYSGNEKVYYRDEGVYARDDRSYDREKRVSDDEKSYQDGDETDSEGDEIVDHIEKPDYLKDERGYLREKKDYVREERDFGREEVASESGEASDNTYEPAMIEVCLEKDVSYERGEGGYRIGDGGYDEREHGYDRGKGGYDEGEDGYDGREGSYDGRESGYERRESGSIRAEGSYDERDAGYSRDEGGYVRGVGVHDVREGRFNRGESGYDKEDDGYDVEEDGYIAREGGYGRQRIGYDNVETGYGREKGGYVRDEVDYEDRESGYDLRDIDYNKGDRFSERAYPSALQDRQIASRTSHKAPIISPVLTDQEFLTEDNLHRNHFSRSRDSNISKNSKNSKPISESSEDPTGSRLSISSGRTWQPKPRSRRRGFDSRSPPKRVTSASDINISSPSFDSNGGSNTSPYRYKVAGSAFNSTKPGAVAGLTPPPSSSRRIKSSSMSSLLSETSPSLTETTV